jgi:N-acetylmuramoyl-L-alanine amidase
MLILHLFFNFQIIICTVLGLYKLMKKLITIFIFTPIILLYSKPTNFYIEIKANKGEGTIQILRKYKLLDFPCSIAEYYKLNNLKKGQSVKVNQKLKLPIYVYKYSGISIRNTLNIEDLNAAKRIQSFNNYCQINHLKNSDYIQNKILWVPIHEIKCVLETKKIISSNKIISFEKTEAKNVKGLFTIFGKKYEKVLNLDSKLRGMTYYLESGHGGPDPGAMTKVGNRTLCEDEYAYDVTLRVARNLLQHGAIVYIINRDTNDGIRDENYLNCDYDEVTYPQLKVPINQKRRLEQRANAINLLYKKQKFKNPKKNIAVIIHVDSRSSDEKIDLFVYHQSNNLIGKNIAKNIHSTLEQKYKGYRKYNGSVETRNLFMLRETKPTTIYIELANIKNDFDRQRIVYMNNRQAIANWLVEGLSK